MSDKARLAAYNAVRRILDGAYSNLISISGDLSGIHRAFAENIALGTLERKVTLEYILSKFIRQDTDRDTVILLMTGVYQIFYMDKVPENSACDETVEIAKEILGRKSAGFVNAVMRNVCRKKQEIIKNIENSHGYIKYSSSKELFELLEEQYPENIDEIFQAFLGKPKMFLRVNTLKTNAKDISQKVDGEIIGEKTVFCNNASDALADIQTGDFYIQGLASQKAVALLDAKKGETVIDVCACPGGKTLGAAIDMENQGRIYAFDLHGNKLSLINKSAEKLGITIIKTEKQDARKPKEDLIGIAHKVICDVPCSGTGVMGSKPEIKYKSPEDFKGLYPTQRAIIASASKYLMIGGEMVYSTCSINKKENEDVVNEFLQQNPNFKLVHQETLLPHEEAHEGFYMAKLKRES